MPVTVAVSPTQIQFTVTVTGGPAGARDWVGLFEINANNSMYLDWRYLANNSKIIRPTSGVSTGTVSLAMPTNADGDYEVRLLSASGVSEFTVLGTSEVFSLGNTKGATIGLTPPPPAGTFTLVKPDGTVWGTVNVT